MTELDYWKECLSAAADDCGLKISDEQLASISEAVRIGKDNFGLAFYSPPSSDRTNEIEREWQQKLDKLQKEFDIYRGNAETAVKTALRQYRDARISIGDNGEVFRHDGRTEQIQ